MTRALTPVLFGTAGVLVLAGLGARLFWKAGPLDLPGTAPAPAPIVPAGAPSGMPPGLAEQVVSANVLSPKRTAPTARYAAIESAASEEAPTPELPAVEAPPRAIRVFGIVMTAGRTTALLDADPRSPGAEIYRAGDALPGGGRVVRITAEYVLVDTPQGRERLRLPSSKAPPAPPSSPESPSDSS